MTKTLLIPLTLTIYNAVCAQSKSGTSLTVKELISEVRKAQEALHTVEYTLQRTDTLVTGNTRTMNGKVLLQMVRQDTIYGFHFYAMQDGDNTEQVYDGHIAYHADRNKKQYEMSMTRAGFSGLTNTGGGRLLIRDLVKIDTEKSSLITLKQDDRYYYLVIHRPDLKEYDVVKRRKTITIDKASMLPVAVREHQENFGRTQDLYYHITGLKINQPLNYSFSSPPFLSEYTQFVPVKTTHPALSLLNKQAPPIALISFDGKKVTSDDFKGKVILLDLWEVWCGPALFPCPKWISFIRNIKTKAFRYMALSTTSNNSSLPKSSLKAKVSPSLC